MRVDRCSLPCNFSNTSRNSLKKCCIDQLSWQTFSGPRKHEKSRFMQGIFPTAFALYMWYSSARFATLKLCR